MTEALATLKQRRVKLLRKQRRTWEVTTWKMTEHQRGAAQFSRECTDGGV